MPTMNYNDHEGRMAKQSLYKLHKYSRDLFEMLDDQIELEAWVQAKIAKAVSDSTGDYQLGYNVGQVADTHPFSVDDFIAVEDNGTSPTIDSNFLSAGTVGKKVTAATGTTISTDIDSSSASADYTYASGKQAIVKRCVKITAGGQALVVEEIQVVGG